jgi:hypothetical protein
MPEPVAPTKLPADAVEGFTILASYARQIAEAGPSKYKFQTYRCVLDFFLTLKMADAQRGMALMAQKEAHDKQTVALAGG